MTGLAETLDRLLAALEGLHDTLTRETEALRKGDADALPGLIAEKNPLLHQIARGWGELTADLGLADAATPSVLTAWITQRDDAAAGRLWPRVLSLADEVGRQNRLNGELIQEHLRHNHAAQQILRDAARRHGLYGADGQSLSMFSGQRTLGEV